VSDVRVVVPSWNTREHLRACLRALRLSRGPGLEVVVVDDASDDGTAEMVAAEHPEVRLVRQATNQGFTAACNRGLEGLSQPFALLLNADAEVEPDAIAELLGFLQRSPAHGAAAPRLLSATGETLRSCMAFPRLRTALWFGTPLERWAPRSAELERYFLRDFDHEDERDVDQPPAACLLLRREALEALRGAHGPAPLDEAMRLYFSDVDLSLRLARAGWRTRYVPTARVVHHVGASTSRHPRRLLQWHLDRLSYYRKHHGRLAGLWVKGCVAWSLADFTLRQALGRVSGRTGEPVAPVLRSFGVFLVR
jgi:N-acetylglucosaminyl-diphospho-decaprenol L-rhamnosyltransferase